MGQKLLLDVLSVGAGTANKEIHDALEEALIAREQLVSKEFEVNHVLNVGFHFKFIPIS
ncbi:hypothetical protein YC2023_073679 [Brassica napus]